MTYIDELIDRALPNAMLRMTKEEKHLDTKVKISKYEKRVNNRKKLKGKKK